MPSHFSTIGLPVKTNNELLDLANRVIGSSRSIEVDNGYYLHWASPSGAELWLQVDAQNNLVGMNPHFSGESQISVALTARVNRPGDTELDGAFYGWADPVNSEPDRGAYPFVFDAPDFNQHAKLSLPVTVMVQMAAFTHEVSLYESKEAFGDSQTSDVKLAAQSFIPSGLFAPDGDKRFPPEASAIFTGIVRRAELRTNELTDNQFWWVWADSLGGSFDVVVDPELLASTPLVGGVLSGSFWLSGRIVTS